MISINEPKIENELLNNHDTKYSNFTTKRLPVAAIERRRLRPFEAEIEGRKKGSDELCITSHDE